MQLGVEEPEAEPGRRAQADAEEEAADDESGDALDGPDASAPSSLHRELAKKLVRYALSSEYSRTPIRRDGIKERGRYPAVAPPPSSTLLMLLLFPHSSSREPRPAV